MTARVLFTIYSNLLKVFEYRGVELTSVPYSEDAFTGHLQHHEYVEIAGKRKDGAGCKIVMLSPSSKYANKNPEFKKLMGAAVARKANPKAPNIAEILFVSNVKLSIHVRKYLDTVRSEMPDLYIEEQDYTIFVIETPRHVNVPRHLIAPDDEVEEHCRRHCTSKEHFPRMYATDPMAVWIGAKPGAVVKIYRQSENSGEAIAYRIVVPAD